MALRFIISPAKKMQATEEYPFATACPQFIEKARVLAAHLHQMDFEQLHKMWACSERLAQDALRQLDALQTGLYMPFDQLSAAICSYNGIQYTNIAASVMPEEHIVWVQKHLRILSGLYGLVRPLDGICPYRLEMQAKLAIDGSHTLYEWWGNTLAHALMDEAAEVHIINLASKEYAQAVVPYLADRTITCLFLSPDAKSGKLVMRAPEIKAARGSFIHWCAEKNIQSAAELREFDERGYRFDAALSCNTKLVFRK
ncbi:MAG: peroxide stress protein YaaA [Atopobium sp.]|uniref:peroxide stress protein YaaA n=1 Tax=Atopobium sp. TaxID=1872650 RepID=UPI002A75F1EE|nr:peroxide stress protein YaaA [Atopobium sp.]MDY2788798.1 peroxide stress protein YaaA [Atopobium sp.]